MIQLSELFPRKTQVPYHEDMPVADVANLDRHGKVLKAGPEASEIRFEGGGTAHSSIETEPDTQSPPYTSYQVRLQQRTRGLVQDEMDAIGFLATDLNIMTDDAGFNKKRHRADGAAARWRKERGTALFYFRAGQVRGGKSNKQPPPWFQSLFQSSNDP